MPMAWRHLANDFSTEVIECGKKGYSWRLVSHEFPTFQRRPFGYTPQLNWRLRGTGEFNANPSDAFVWHDSNSGRVANWHFNSAGQFSYSLLGTTPYPREIYSAGNSEILWYNPNSTQPAVWSVNGNTTTASAINIFPGSTWLVQPFSN